MDYLGVRAILLQYILDIKNLISISRDTLYVIQYKNELQSKRSDIEQISYLVNKLNALLNEANNCLTTLDNLCAQKKLEMSKLELIHEINFNVSNLDKLKSLDTVVKNLLYKQT